MLGFGIAGLALGAINLLGISAVLKGNSFLFFRDERSAFIGAFVVALVMCAIGINTTLQNTGYRVAGMIVGGVLGLSLVAILVFYLGGQTIPVG